MSVKQTEMVEFRSDGVQPSEKMKTSLRSERSYCRCGIAGDKN